MRRECFSIAKSIEYNYRLDGSWKVAMIAGIILRENPTAVVILHTIISFGHVFRAPEERI
jgi:hypothetical protein